VVAVAVSADGRVGASVDTTGELVRYNLTLGQRAGSSDAPGAQVIALSPSMVAWAAGEEVCLLNHMAGRTVWRAGGWGRISSLAFASGGAALVVGTASRAVVLRTATGRVVGEVAGAVDALAWDGDASLVLVGAGRWSRRDAALHLQDPGGPTPRGVRGVVAQSEPWLWLAGGLLVPARAAAWSAGATVGEGPFLAFGAVAGGWIACDAGGVSCAPQGTVDVQRRPWSLIADDPGEPTSLAGHPSGAHLLWGAADGRVQIGRWREE
jgi:uncharacterized membrane protein